MDNNRETCSPLVFNEPKVLITTSRDPSSRLASFAKEMKLIFPHSETLNRGRREMREIVDAARFHHFSDLIVLHEHRGKPNGIVISHLQNGPTVYFELTGVVTRHDVGTKYDVGNISQSNPHLIYEGFQSKLGNRVKSIIRHLFPVPKERTKRVLAFLSKLDSISFRSYSFDVSSELKKVTLIENGPRFEMVPYQIRLGTLDQSFCDIEWTRKCNNRNSKVRQIL